MALEAGTSLSLSSSPCVVGIPLSATGSGTGSITGTGRDSPVVFAPNNEAEEWSREWASVLARGASLRVVLEMIVYVLKLVILVYTFLPYKLAHMAFLFLAVLGNS